MDRKLKNTLILIAIILVIALGGGAFSYWYQDGKIVEKQKAIKNLNLNAYDTEDLIEQLKQLKAQAAQLDSILSLRKFNIPNSLKQSAFFEFVNKVSFSFMPYSYVNVEYIGQDLQNEFEYYTYKLTGVASFNDLYKLIFAIEHSKELKKILYTHFNNFVKVTPEGEAYYLVDYDIGVAVYYAHNDRFAAAEFKENRLTPNPLYDIFYPLIRNEIPPNKDNLLDVQTAHLLALIPDGAFLSDENGNTFLLWEGDKVYLGYLTKIDYEKSEVRFVLNKGGIIEKVNLGLEKGNEKNKESVQ